MTVEDVEDVTEDDTVEDVTDGGENTVTAWWAGGNILQKNYYGWK